MEGRDQHVYKEQKRYPDTDLWCIFEEVGRLEKNSFEIICVSQNLRSCTKHKKWGFEDEQVLVQAWVSDYVHCDYNKEFLREFEDVEALGDLRLRSDCHQEQNCKTDGEDNGHEVGVDCTILRELAGGYAGKVLDLLR